MESNVKDTQLIVLEMAKIFDDVCKKNNIDYTLSSGSILGAIRHKGFIPWDGDMDVLVPINQYDLMRKKIKERIKNTDYVLHEWDKEKKYPEVVDRLCPKGVEHEKIHFDIFPLIGAPDDKKKQKRFADICFYSYRLLRCKYCNTDYSKPNHVKKIKMIKPFLKIVPDKLIIRWYHHLQSKYDYEKSKYVHILASGYGVDETLERDLYMNTKYVKFEDTTLRIPERAEEYLQLIYGKDYMTPLQDGYKKIDKKGTNK